MPDASGDSVLKYSPVPGRGGEDFTRPCCYYPTCTFTSLPLLQYSYSLAAFLPTPVAEQPNQSRSKAQPLPLLITAHHLSPRLPLSSSLSDRLSTLAATACTAASANKSTSSAPLRAYIHPFAHTTPHSAFYITPAIRRPSSTTRNSSSAHPPLHTSTHSQAPPQQWPPSCQVRRLQSIPLPPAHSL